MPDRTAGPVPDQSPHPGFAPELAAILPDAWTRPFWEAAREHRLVAPRCGVCGTFRMPPTAFCWNCRSQDTEWVTLSGKGTVYTFTVARHALTPAARGAVPYVVAVVALDGAPGARLISNIVGVPVEEVAIGMAVEVVFDDVTAKEVTTNGVPPTSTVPRFRPTAGLGRATNAGVADG